MNNNTIYYCNKCGGLTIQRKYRVFYTYEVVVTGKTSQTLTEVLDNYECFKSPKRIKLDVNYNKTNKVADRKGVHEEMHTELIKTGTPSCNSVIPRYERTCVNTKLQAIKIDPRLYEALFILKGDKYIDTCDKSLLATLYEQAEDIREKFKKYKDINNITTLLQYAMEDGFVEKESLTLVTTILLK